MRFRCSNNSYIGSFYEGEIILSIHICNSKENIILTVLTVVISAQFEITGSAADNWKNIAITCTIRTIRLTLWKRKEYVLSCSFIDCLFSFHLRWKILLNIFTMEKWIKSNLNWLISDDIILILSLQLLIVVDMRAGKLGDMKYVMLFLISWSHVATTVVNESKASINLSHHHYWFSFVHWTISIVHIRIANTFFCWIDRKEKRHLHTQQAPKPSAHCPLAVPPFWWQSYTFIQTPNRRPSSDLHSSSLGVAKKFSTAEPNDIHMQRETISKVNDEEIRSFILYQAWNQHRQND